MGSPDLFVCKKALYYLHQSKSHQPALLFEEELMGAK